MDFLLLILSSFGLGALHTLEPGHGKAVMGAYLVGSKGRVSDAILLGIVVTLTHTGGVIILGVVSMVAASFFVPETIEKVLEITSGLLIIGVGLWMLVVRSRQTCKHKTHNNEYFDDQVHTHQEHSHGHNQEHEHEGHPHSHVLRVEPGQRATLWQLIALGVSGGIVPCWSALAVLLAAVSFGQFTKAIFLVIVHSIGMATVLVAIGIAMVKTADYASKYVSEHKWSRYAPSVSAIVVLLMGIILTVKAVLEFL